MASGPSLKCPRCSASVGAAPDDSGFVVCSQCGSKLRSRTPAIVKVQGVAQSVTPAPGDIDSMLARLDAPLDPSATLPPGTPLRKIPRPEEVAAAAAAKAASSTAAAATPARPILETLLAETREVRRIQEEILHLLRSRPSQPAPFEPESADGDPFSEIDEPLPMAPVRSRRRKTLLLIDDDDATRQAAVQALERAEVPVTTAKDGNEGVAQIAIEKPDVVAMELGLRGAMAGKDVINVIKATMEWIDIPIILYTRVPVASQKEARQLHGADEVVLKEAGADALVSKVIATFRRG